MLGCYDEARESRLIHNGAGIGGWNADKRALDNGWSFLGSGHSRHAYLSPTNVVYKVGQERTNESEHKAATLMRRIESPLVGIPETYYYDDLGVLAMQFVDGLHGIPDSERWQYQAEVDKFGAVDQWFRNLIFDGEKVWIIDLGEFADDGSFQQLKRRVSQLSKK